MKGFPKHLNSKQDYEYIKANFLKTKWQPCWKALLSESKQWFYTKTLSTIADGITDETHKIITSKDINNNTIYMQYELKTDTSSDMIRLGFTEDEIKKALGE